MQALNNKKVINAWALFDWANSTYSLIISTAIFPPYFIQVTKPYIDLLGWEVSNSALYAFSVALSYLVIAFVTPLLSGMADYGGKRKFFLKLFTWIGSLSCMALFFFEGMSTVALGLIAFIMATIGHAGSLVFYNAYLPEIASEDQWDRVSAKGYAWGYFGSVILLLANLMLITRPHWFGIEEGTLAVRLSYLSVGIWWIGFAHITFKHLPENKSKEHDNENLLVKGFEELKLVWNSVKESFNIKRFLFSFLFYSAGVQTIIYLAASFAEKELSFSTQELILVILILQLVAILGAYLFAAISKWKGNKLSLNVMILIWIGICITGYFIQDKLSFYMMAGAVGMVLGGIQSLSRSTYSKLIPVGSDDMTSYFSFYDFMYKISIVMGTVSFGLVDQITGSMRLSILVLGMFFIVGFVLLQKVKLKHLKLDEAQ